jgi:hypothetical protein
MPSYSFSFSSSFLSCSSSRTFSFLSLCFFFIYSYSRGSQPDPPFFGGLLAAGSSSHFSLFTALFRFLGSCSWPFFPFYSKTRHMVLQCYLCLLKTLLLDTPWFLFSFLSSSPLSSYPSLFSLGLGFSLHSVPFIYWYFTLICCVSILLVCYRSVVAKW